MKTLVISDSHLRGIDDPVQARFLGLLDSLEGSIDTVYLLGDIFEFWIEYPGRIFEGYRPVVERFAAFAARGVRFVYLTGNHDFEISATFGAMANFTVADESYFDERGGRRIYLSHGDMIDQDDRGYLFLRGFLRSRIFRFIKAIVPACIAFRLAGAFSRASRAVKNNQNQRLAALMRTWASERLGRGDADIVALGHSHVADLRTFEHDGSYVNPGGFLGDGSYALIDEQGRVTLERCSS